MSILELKGVSVARGAGPVIRDVDLVVSSGEVVAIVGPNGAGKTTFFNMISGFLSSTAGSIEFDGRDTTPVRQDQVAAMGLVRTFQLVQLFTGLSVAESVDVGCHLATKGGVELGRAPV